MRGYLERGGYHVMTAKDGTEALAVAEGAQDPIDLLVTDMALPGLKGPEIAAQIASLHPGIEILFMSAHPTDKLLAEGRLPAGCDSLQKPFSEEALLLEVQRALYPDKLAEASQAALDEFSVASIASAPSTRPADSDRPTLLLVEDHETARWTTRELLEDEGFQVLEAGDGATALHIVGEHGAELDLVICDLRLPDVGGAALAEQLREQQPGLPFIFTSGKSDDDPEVEQALQAANTTFLGKPVGFDTLLDRVEQLLDERVETSDVAQ